MNVHSRAKRILNHLSSYQLIEHVDLELEVLLNEAKLHNAIPIGVYINVKDDQKEPLLMSDLGVFMRAGDTVSVVKYKDIKQVEVVAGTICIKEETALKLKADGLMILTEDAHSYLIPMRNGEGRYRDAFEFARFISRAANDAKAPL